MAKRGAVDDAANHYKVMASQWKQWSKRARRAFNYVFGTMNENQRLYSHPKAAVVPPAHWKTVAWNAAWTAAELTDGNWE